VNVSAVCCCQINALFLVNIIRIILRKLHADNAAYGDHKIRSTLAFLLGMCGKPKFGSDSVFKNRTVQKFDIRSDRFPTELRANPQIMLKVTKNTLLAFKCAHNCLFVCLLGV